MLTKEDVRGVSRVIVLLAGVFVLLSYCGLVGISYVPIAYGHTDIDSASSERIDTWLRPARIALFFGAPAALAAMISAVRDYKRFHWVALVALVALIGVMVTVDISW